MRTEEAFEFLVQYLGTAPKKHNDSDLYVPNTVGAYWQSRRPNFTYSDLSEEDFQPFYEAAWELCRIGVLRPGRFAPHKSVGGSFTGMEFTITGFGKVWLNTASQRPIVDSSRLSEVLQAFAARFGDGYAQRATESVRTYRTCNYLATCVMAGAAAESILLALAIGKVGDETKVLAAYKSKNGRVNVTNQLLAGAASGIADRFRLPLQVLHYWRDDAAHGVMTTISEIEAYASLTQLLRLAQFASDHWDRLTA